MKSEIWKKNRVVKAFTTGFSKNEIEFFDKECEDFLTVVINLSMSLNNTFSPNSKSLKKANWIILNDISCSLYDCLYVLRNGNIRLASRVFRDVLENLHLLELFNKSGNKNLLKKWYNDDFIPHRKYRDWLKKQDEDLSELTRKIFGYYSKYSHRTIKSILESSNNSEKNNLVFKLFLDKNNEKDLKTLSIYYSHLSYFVLNSSLNYSDYKVLNTFKLSVMANEATKNIKQDEKEN